MDTRPPTSDSDVAELLQALRSPARDDAWRRFLDRFAEDVLRVVRQSTGDVEERDDCFLFVCQKLCEVRFRRLRKYEPQASASFRSWLRVVVSNLCIDWQRSRSGRQRPFSNILDLDALAQRVFHYRFQKRLTLRECVATLQAEFPGVSEPQVAGALTRVETALTPRQRWLLSASQTEVVSLDGESSPEPPEPGPDPEQRAALAEQRTRLQRALGRLSPRQRQLLVMRYQEELSLKEIARLARLGDPFRARREIQSAVDALAALLEG